MKIDVGSVTYKMDKIRDEILKKTLADAIARWKPQKNGSRSEQDYLSEFAAGRNISNETAKKYILYFKLDRSSWNYEGVEAVFDTIISDRNFDPSTSVGDYATRLTNYLNLDVRNRRDRLDNGEDFFQGMISAASKISMFARPEKVVFIWDTAAMSSLLWRIGRTDFIAPSFRTAEGPDYGRYLEASAEEFARECEDTDFQEIFRAYRNAIEPLNDTQNLITDEFLKRRLFDKLLYQEGKKLAPILKDERDAERVRRREDRAQ